MTPRLRILVEGVMVEPSMLRVKLLLNCIRVCIRVCVLVRILVCIRGQKAISLQTVWRVPNAAP